MPPVLVGRLEYLADELAARTAAIDEQISAQFAAVLELQLVDETVFTAGCANNLALEPDDAGALGERAQVARRECRIDVQRISQVRSHAE